MSDYIPLAGQKIVDEWGSLTITGADLFQGIRREALVVRSPNGTRYQIVVDDSGNLSTEAL
jgi:hypothetical protein